MKVIGVAGFARAGKDTFVAIAIDILKANGYKPFRVAFADKLKEETEAMLQLHGFSATVRTDDTKAKTLIRPLLVWWGCQRRNESPEGLYWVNEVDKQLSDEAAKNDDNIIALVSDVRFPNEAKWVQEKWEGNVIHMKRWKKEYRRGGQDGSDTIECKTFDPAPNEEEAKQDPLVEAAANVRIEWENQNASLVAAVNNPVLREAVLEALNKTKFFKLDKPITGKLTL